MPHEPPTTARRARGRRAAPALMALLAALACAEERPASRPVVLLVAVASSLQGAIGEIEVEFERAHPGVDLRPTVLSSGAAHRQLLAGAPYQALVAADTIGPAALERAGRTEPGTRVAYARGGLALWLSNRLPGIDGRDGLAALASQRLHRLAIPNPEVAPYGRAALEVLQRAQSSGTQGTTIVRGEDAAHAAQLALAGADAALLPLSLALAPEMQRAGRAYPIPDSLYAAITHELVLVRGASRHARAFHAFLTAAPGQRILARFGFRVP